MAQTADPLLQRPLYVFDLPEELLYTLELKEQLNNALDPTSDTPSISKTSDRLDAADGAPSSATACALCNLNFSNVEDQRSHVRSDLHGYNLKQKLRGLKPVGENDFDKLVGDLDESISGSDDSDSESDEDDEGNTKRKDTTLSSLLKKQAHIADPDFDDNDDNRKMRKRGSGKPPLLWLSSSKLPSNMSLGVYRALFTPTEQASDSNTFVQTIKRKQLSPKPPPPPQPKQKQDEEGGVALPPSMVPDTSAAGPHYLLCMIGGGHFAAMVVSLTPKKTRKGVDDRSATVIASKTFHRYTTRRKQGGSQSANDSSKGAAHSAGSSLRRYNEAALVQDVRNLLHEWKGLIDTSELIFIRATGTTNRRTLFGPYDGQVLTANDQRIRGFPFNTRRATQGELMRAFVELTRVKISTIDEAALAAKAAEEESARVAAEAKASAKAAAVVSKPRPSREDEEAALHTTQLTSLIRRSKAPGLVSYLSSNSLSPNFLFFPPDAPTNHHAPTPLHLAASLNAPAVISALLLKAQADPTTKSQEGKTAFEIAGDRATRDSFRLARSELGEARWAWDTAGIPAALSKTEVDKRAEREKLEKAEEDKQELERRKIETERLRQEDREKVESQKERKFGKGRSLVAVEKTAEEKRMEEARGMTPEMRMRLERERRARAAEARMKALGGK